MTSPRPNPGAMPEPQWIWRRLLTWVVVAAVLVAVHRVIGLIPPAHLAPVADRLIWLLGAVVTLYLIGPTAEHIVALVRAWRGSSS